MLLSEYNSLYTYLQETHFKPGQAYTLKNYNIIRKDFEMQVRISGDVANILSKDFMQLNINTDLQVVAARILTPFSITICNIYLPKY